jgi:hypothetical protein
MDKPSGPSMGPPSPSTCRRGRSSPDLRVVAPARQIWAATTGSGQQPPHPGTHRQIQASAHRRGRGMADLGTSSAERKGKGGSGHQLTGEEGGGRIRPRGAAAGPSPPDPPSLELLCHPLPALEVEVLPDPSRRGGGAPPELLLGGEAPPKMLLGG